MLVVDGVTLSPCKSYVIKVFMHARAQHRASRNKVVTQRRKRRQQYKCVMIMYTNSCQRSDTCFCLRTFTLYNNTEKKQSSLGNTVTFAISANANVHVSIASSGRGRVALHTHYYDVAANGQSTSGTTLFFLLLLLLLSFVAAASAASADKIRTSNLPCRGAN